MRKIKTALIFSLSVFLLISFCQPVMASKGKININTAAKKELVTLKGIGDKIADRIIEHRKAHKFEKIEDIMKVKGIGQKMFDKIKDSITVQDE